MLLSNMVIHYLTSSYCTDAWPMSRLTLRAVTGNLAENGIGIRTLANVL